jgi:hypothetical protein
MDKQALVGPLPTALTIYESGLTGIFSSLLDPEMSHHVKGSYGINSVLTAGCAQPEAKHEEPLAFPVLANQ